ncbi:MAG: hypothetical protein AAGA18_01605 [Verrucomicrobiota bacterium]
MKYGRHRTEKIVLPFPQAKVLNDLMPGPVREEDEQLLTNLSKMLMGNAKIPASPFARERIQQTLLDPGITIDELGPMFQ